VRGERPVRPPTRPAADLSPLAQGEVFDDQAICHDSSSPAHSGTSPDSLNGSSSGTRQVFL